MDVVINKAVEIVKKKPLYVRDKNKKRGDGCKHILDSRVCVSCMGVCGLACVCGLRAGACVHIRLQ